MTEPGQRAHVSRQQAPAAEASGGFRNLLEVLGLVEGPPTAAPTAAVPLYDRAAVPNDAEVEAFHATGLHRLALHIAYACILAVAWGGAIATLFTHPSWLLPGLVLGYLSENFSFVVAHVGLHASFIEYDEPRMATVTHHGFLHHYRHRRVYQESWLESRLSYFFCPRRGAASFSTWGSIVTHLVTAGVVAAFDPMAGLAALSCMWLPRLLQSVVHEWYHNDRREDFYFKPTFVLLTALERVGLISTRHHAKHHAHHLRNLDHVHYWTDMATPGFDRLGDRMWAWVKERHQPGKMNMIRATSRIFFTWAPVHFGAIAALFLLLAATA